MAAPFDSGHERPRSRRASRSLKSRQRLSIAVGQARPPTVLAATLRVVARRGIAVSRGMGTGLTSGPMSLRPICSGLGPLALSLRLAMRTGLLQA